MDQLVQFVVVKAELDRMNTENERLRAILDDTNAKYYSLKMHVLSILNQNKSDDHKVCIKLLYTTLIN